MNSIPIELFLEKRKEYQIIDVRTPLEFENGHIPGAHNIPLFSNEERAIVGTIYKKQGKEPAVLKGLEFVGPKMKDFVLQARSISQDKPILVHCWRGGMRSGSMSWLFRTAGIQAYTLQGGYKAYRGFAREYWAKAEKLIILGGRTGSGKTVILKELKNIGEQVVDLEGLAHHKGSAFGALGQSAQPSTEYFENTLFEDLWKMDLSLPIWLEDESKSIGRVFIPDAIFDHMRFSPTLFLDMPVSVRVNHLKKEYATFPADQLKNGILRIQKRLGGLRTQQALDSITEKRFDEAIAISLEYYDKAYNFGLTQRPPEKVITIPVENDCPIETACELQKIVKQRIEESKLFFHENN